jgi:hypothetical protein
MSVVVTEAAAAEARSLSGNCQMTTTHKPTDTRLSTTSVDSFKRGRFARMVSTPEPEEPRELGKRTPMKPQD